MTEQEVKKEKATLRFLNTVHTVFLRAKFDAEEHSILFSQLIIDFRDAVTEEKIQTAKHFRSSPHWKPDSP